MVIFLFSKHYHIAINRHFTINMEIRYACNTFNVWMTSVRGYTEIHNHTTIMITLNVMHVICFVSVMESHYYRDSANNISMYIHIIINYIYIIFFKLTYSKPVETYSKEPHCSWFS